MLSYKNLSMVTSLICSTLFLVLMFAPELIFQLFGATGNETAHIVARRTSMFLMGYAIIAFSSRMAQPSATRQAISLGIALSMLGLSILGVYEFLRGSVGMGVFLAVSAELFLFVSYSLIWLADRKVKA